MKTQTLVNVPDNFQDALKVKEELEKSLNYASESWKGWQQSYALENGIPEKSAIGLTNDLIKKNPLWIQYSQHFDLAMKTMQNYNRVFVKKFKKQYRDLMQEKRFKK